MSFYRDKKCVVTGGAGMVGSHLVELLLDAEADVLVLDNFSRGRTRVDGADYEHADVSDYGTCREFFNGADYVLNLAAEVAGVEFNQRNHTWMFERNLALQSVPLRAAADSGVKRFLQVSSVCVYAPRYNNPALEKNGHRGEPVGANAGYSWAKRMGERLARWNTSSEHGLHTVIVRPTNIYGPRDYFDKRAHVIPALIGKALFDDKIVVNGTGREVREFIYVEDAARGMMAALERGKPGEAYNLGTSGATAVTMKELAETITALCGVDKEIVFESNFDAGDDVRTTDSSRAHNTLGWIHRVPLAEGLHGTIEWYKEVCGER